MSKFPLVLIVVVTAAVASTAAVPLDAGAPQVETAPDPVPTVAQPVLPVALRSQPAPSIAEISADRSVIAATPVQAPAQEVSSEARIAAMAQDAGARRRTNIRLELVIVDSLGENSTTKQVSMVVRSGGSGSIRTSAAAPPPGRSQGEAPQAGTFMGPNGPRSMYGEVALNLDARPTSLGDDLVEVSATFEYTPALSQPDGSYTRPTQLGESIQVVLRDGQELLVSQSADPVTNRTVRVTLKATVLE